MRLIQLVLDKDIEGIRDLLQQGGDVNEQNQYGEVALHYVDDLNIAKLLLQYGANVNIQDEYGSTPLIFMTDSDIVKLFLDHGAKTHISNIDGDVFLESVISRNILDVIRVLAIYGVK